MLSGFVLRQMTLLRCLKHENVIAVLDIMAPPAAQVGIGSYSSKHPSD